ncbi:MAG TPA: metalloregulator ArsR/SmtB family transcription factor [Microbacteriaceae bacterium]|nr:metalloregulator ArsR/SmtB family transcription factor [Microbacteriaceae bacterium]
MTEIFGVIADATRRDLLAHLLAAEELSVGALVEQTGLTQPTVSKHLKVLRDTGLVTVREEAQHRFYRLDPAPLDALVDWLAPFLPDDDSADYDWSAADGVPLIAWSGAEAGQQLGRVAAETAHTAQAALDRLERVTDRARHYLADVGAELQRLLGRD